MAPKACFVPCLKRAENEKNMQIKIHSYLFMIIVGGECLRLCAMCMHNCARCVFYNCIHKVKIDVCAMQFHRMKTANETKKNQCKLWMQRVRKKTRLAHIRVSHGNLCICKAMVYGYKKYIRENRWFTAWAHRIVSIRLTFCFVQFWMAMGADDAMTCHENNRHLAITTTNK